MEAGCRIVAFRSWVSGRRGRPVGPLTSPQRCWAPASRLGTWSSPTGSGRGGMNTATSSAPTVMTPAATIAPTARASVNPARATDARASRVGDRDRCADRVTGWPGDLRWQRRDDIRHPIAVDRVHDRADDGHAESPGELANQDVDRGPHAGSCLRDGAQDRVRRGAMTLAIGIPTRRSVSATTQPSVDGVHVEIVARTTLGSTAPR